MPLGVAAIVLACYIAVVASHLASGGDVRDYIFLGTRYIEQSHASPAIRIDPHYHYLTNRHGYDGQFYYYIAADPVRARYYVDWNSYGRQAAAYRYGRILYPLLARTLTLGQSSWVPSTLLVVNLLGVALGTLAVAAWILRFGLPTWLALVYSFYPGVALGVLRDLADPLAFSFVAAAVFLLSFGGRYRLVWSVALFALAGLTRETTLLVPLLYALWRLVHRDWRSSTILGLGSAAPFLLWKLWLLVWLGSFALPHKVAPVLPFSGIAEEWHWRAADEIQMLGVVLPSLLIAAVALAAWLRKSRSPEILVLIANVIVFVIVLNPTSYVDIYGSARMAIGVPLFALFSLPTLLTRVRRPVWIVFAVCVALWAATLLYTL